MKCVYCGIDGAHDGTQKCWDATACEVRFIGHELEVALTRVAQLEAERDEVAAAYERGWNKETHVLKELLAAAHGNLSLALEGHDRELAAANADRARMTEALEKIVRWVEHKGNQLGERYTYAAEKHGWEAPETRAASNRLHDYRNANLNTLSYAKQALTSSDAAAWLHERDMRVAEAVRSACIEAMRVDGTPTGMLRCVMEPFDLAVVAGVK